MFTRLLAVARELTGARYAAIGVLDERREGLERFLTSGIGEDAHRAIGNLPGGLGVLGVLTSDPRPLRLADVGAHPQSYGFPAAHPPMTSFLGVPIVIEGQAWGNLYLTEKAGGEFTDEDEEAAVVLADWAAIAITNARLYRDVRERRDELERTNRGLETTTEISRALAGVTDLDQVLELVVKRSRALIDARVAEIALLEGDEFVIAAVAGEGVGGPARPAAPDRRFARRYGPEIRAAGAHRADPGRHVRVSRAGGPLRARHADVVPQPAGRLSDRVRPVARRPAVQRGGRAPARGLCRERRDRGGDRAACGRRGAAA